MNTGRTTLLRVISFLLVGAFLFAVPHSASSQERKTFQISEGAKAYTHLKFKNDPRSFQFVIIGDRTGGANAEGTFKLAIGQLNLLQPEFVINVGDMIEGYSDDAAELSAEWDELDGMLKKLDMPFFRTPATTTSLTRLRSRSGGKGMDPHTIISSTMTYCSWFLIARIRPEKLRRG